MEGFMGKNEQQEQKLEEENSNQAKFEFDVPYNNELLVKQRKKAKITTGVVLMVAFVMFLFMTIGSATGTNSAPWVVVLFVGFDLACLIPAIFFFLNTKPKAKDDNKTVKYFFYEDLLQIKREDGTENGKVRVLESCLYRKYSGKQYVAKTFEFEDKFQVQIFTGTTNGVPQYSHHIIPKSVFVSDEQLNEFREFVKFRLEKDFVVKESKK